MLNEIKSKIVLKTIFFHIYEGRKLKILIYNKELLNKLKINIIDYKRLCIKYIVGERNGYAKEYNNNDGKLIFEGEYKNGKRNGKGKEYDKYSNLIFDGEYLDGKRWNGHVWEYDLYNLIFEGEYLNGEKKEEKNNDEKK